MPSWHTGTDGRSSGGRQRTLPCRCYLCNRRHFAPRPVAVQLASWSDRSCARRNCNLGTWTPLEHLSGPMVLPLSCLKLDGLVTIASFPLTLTAHVHPWG